jgi:hypothetical protein
MQTIGTLLVAVAAVSSWVLACSGRAPSTRKSASISVPTNNPEAASPATPTPVTASTPTPVAPPAAAKVSSAPLPHCAARIAEVQTQPAMPGAPGFEQARQWLLLNAKAEPLFFTQKPTFTAEPFLPSVGRNRALLERSEHPWDVISRLVPQFKIAPREGRETLLRDGYLYTEKPDLAFALVNQVSAEHLFGHQEIWLMRGSNLYHAKRSAGKYRFTDGPNQGEPVRLLLLDRVGTGAPPESQPALDLRSLQYELHFSAARIQHVTNQWLVAELQYGSQRVPSLLRVRGATLGLECEAATDADTTLTSFRAEAQRRQRVVQGLRSVILEQVDEQLPFDEPRREWGAQMDGRLRSNWQVAYEQRKSDFALNGDLYPVFDRKGRPQVPQVCVDFLADTLERFSGNWFRPKGQPPGRNRGKLSLVPSEPVERAKFRRVPDFVAWATANPDKFQVLDIPEQERVPLGNREALLAQLERRKSDFQPGDILVIRGPTPWDATQMHYHSFFVYESDPITGIPIAVVGNAGRPTIRNWETEIRRTPERWIQHRLRPTTDWLESIASDDLTPPATPLSLSPLGNAG